MSQGCVNLAHPPLAHCRVAPGAPVAHPQVSMRSYTIYCPCQVRHGLDSRGQPRRQAAESGCCDSLRRQGPVQAESDSRVAFSHITGAEPRTGCERGAGPGWIPGVEASPWFHSIVQQQLELAGRGLGRRRPVVLEPRGPGRRWPVGLEPQGRASFAARPSQALSQGSDVSSVCEPSPDWF